ncbi:hypothetical protein C1752_01272 [Acaryochloris thomasi RCC1774]|uniref:Exosortase O n=1 Tax=Acaryochloris thomasi RCC1774 TaxID=1764569 RepID=A0A2W1K0I1_9CYAN|nr:exosortase O [Acaryochloris thomasi]PZD74131.1 hypothetical protein C1752_01272 [Acaryochloris thomasi RCC1774]
MTYDNPLARFEADPTHVLSLNRLLGVITILLWLVLFLPELMGFTHLLKILSLFNILLLAGAAAVLFIQGFRCRDQWKFSLEPTFQGLPLLVMVGVAIASLLTRNFLDLENLSAVGAIIGAYGLMGLFCDTQTWKRNIPFVGAFAILVFLFALELTDLGHLARTGIAEIVEYLLQPFSVNAITSEDILVLSTGVAFVDIPCSGFKNIEIGSLFFIAASMLERRQMGLRWFLVGVTNFALLIVANIARIFVIVTLTFVLQQRTVAEILHVPLGLCGFISVCLLTLLLLQFVPHQRPSTTKLQESRKTQSPAANIRNALITLGLLLGLALIPHPTAAAVGWDSLQWPTSMQAESVNLTRPEQMFFTQYPGVVAQKQAFKTQNISGSMIFVASPSWQAHHAPELCFLASGFKIDDMQKRTLTSQVTGRWLSLDQGQRQAAYWFQSSQRTTDHYLDRVWSEMIRKEPHWTMVSILFDQSVSADDAAVQAVLADVHDAISTAMT